MCGAIGPAGFEGKFALSIDDETHVSGAEKKAAEANHKKGDTALTTDGVPEGATGAADNADIDNNLARAATLTSGREILADSESD